jgi:hypothetical protein
MHDLIKNKRFASVGGEAVFRQLCISMTKFSTDAKKVRAVVTGSSGQLKIALNNTGLVTGARITTYSLMDPAEDATRVALENRGYSQVDAAKIVDACGARLRVLEGPLMGRQRQEADEFLKLQESNTFEQFSTFFAALADDDKKAAQKLLDQIEAAAAAPGKVAPPRASAITSALEDANFSSVVFISDNFNLIFQSRMHRTVWKKHREALLSDAGIVDARSAV